MTNRRSRGRLVIAAIHAVVLSSAITPPATAQRSDDPRVSELASRVATVEGRLRSVEQDAAAGAAVLFLFGAFCALWAQNTRRNAWIWFVLGLFFSVFTVLVLLYKNSTDVEPDT